jgi:hypothetical protein
VTSELLPRELQILAASVLFAFLGWVLYLIRYHRLSLRDSLLWLLSTAGMLAITLFPVSLQGLASVLHVGVPSNALFGLAILYLVLNSLAATTAISAHAQRVRRLTQECALLRAEIDLLQDRREQAERKAS